MRTPDMLGLKQQRGWLHNVHGEMYLETSGHWPQTQDKCKLVKSLQRKTHLPEKWNEEDCS